MTVLDVSDSFLLPESLQIHDNLNWQLDNSKISRQLSQLGGLIAEDCHEFLCEDLVCRKVCILVSELKKDEITKHRWLFKIISSVNVVFFAKTKISVISDFR